MATIDGYNLFLIIVTIVMAFVIAATTLYLLIVFSHPEDRMQAWGPKIVVCFSMFVAISTVLFFPLDVANRQACDGDLLYSDCDFTLPMKDMWYGIYIVNVVLVYLVTPFTLFYYEADSDYTLMRRVISALMWTMAAAVMFIIMFVIVYAIGGNVEYDSMLLASGTLPVDSIGQLGASACISSVGALEGDACSAFLGADKPNVVFEFKAPYTIYIVAAASILGWLLFMVFGGVGLIALPIDMIMTFFARPKKTISKSEYMMKARELAGRASGYRDAANALKREETDSGRSRAWRKRYKALNTDLNMLEDEQRELEHHFPQGEDRDTKWVLYVISFWASLFFGILFAIVAFTWIIHICVYVLPSKPLHPFLNSFFSGLDNAFRLFGVSAFSIWCFFLILATIKGFTKLGLNFVFIRLYPMKVGATLMSSFLVNSALILLASTAVVQFCATAFEPYANETAIQDIFGSTIYNISALKHVFSSNVFIYVFLVFAALTLLWTLIRGPGAQKRKKMSLEEIYAA